MPDTLDALFISHTTTSFLQSAIDLSTNTVYNKIYNPLMLKYELRNRLRAVLHFVLPIFPQDPLLKLFTYIDGFNLYNGCLKGSPYRWLNLHTFAQQLRPTDEILKVKFFTARLHQRLQDPDQPKRQIIYWRALRTIDSIEIIEGQFLTKATRLPDVADIDRIKAQHDAGANTRGIWPIMHHVYRSEEKGTDVNLAVHLVNDAHLNRFDGAVVVSNDSDLVEAVRIVRDVIHKPVFVFHPHSPTPSFKLKQVATRFREVAEAHLSASQFPATLSDAKGIISKPESW